MHGWLTDLRYALRGLARNRGFCAACVLTLALGIGANVAIFSAVDTLLLRPLPYPNAGRLVMVWEDASYVSFPRNTPAVANYVDWRAQNQVFSDMAAMRFRGANLTGEGLPESVRGRGVTANFFAVMGVMPAIGRPFTEDEDRRSAKVVVLSHGLWTRRFGCDRGLIGRPITMNGEPVTVIGVMPRSFRFPDPNCQYWVPASFTPQQLAERGSHFLTVVARLRDGVSLERARAEMYTIATRLEKQYPATNTKVGAVVSALREEMTGDTRLGLLVLLAAAGCVLLIACANVANLLLARGAGRRRELAVRAALGAGGGRLIRQMITESLLLAGLGGAAGVGLAAAGRVVLEKIVPPGFAGDAQLALNGRLLLFALGVSLATGLFFGLAPAVTASRWSVVEALKQGGRGGLGTGGRFRKGLAVAEVALSALLLVSAGLLVQTLLRLRGLDLGFQPEKMLTMLVSLPNPKYADPARREAFELAVLGNVRSLPGVRGAAFTTNLPFTSIGNTVGFAIEGQPAAGPGDNRDVMARVGSADYLPVLGVTLREGRFFTADDRAGSRQVVIVNEFLAKRFWPGQSALGKR
ncbi:MAG: ABC transporter permease, partial [Acidobacteria bacterium]|nr:ABC transporter permease [Acidobacteriota bacterium]